MNRPAHLPDYSQPPLNEVVLGIQFAAPDGYQTIHAGEVWGLFKDKFPICEPKEPLEPVFETFGFQQPQFKFGIITGPMPTRFWFLNKNREELLQFQHDKFLHNWRKVENEDNHYPHFEEIINNFEQEIRALESYFLILSGKTLNINQCELTYMNHIPVKEEDRFEWLNILNMQDIQADDFMIRYRETIKDEAGKPIARLMSESYLGFAQNGGEIIVLNLTVRGIPNQPTIDSSLQFLKKSREKIVSHFDKITTQAAHQKWGKKK